MEGELSIKDGEERVNRDCLDPLSLTRGKYLLCHDLLELIQGVKLELKENLLFCAARAVAALHGLVQKLVEIYEFLIIPKKM
jgi:hypothetical protein